MLPAKYLSSGVIQVASDPTGSAPYDFYGSNSAWEGLEVDLATAMGQVMGVQFHFNALQFPGIIPAIQAGRYDVGMSAFGDFAPREKVVDEIDYETEATGIAVPQGNPLHISRIQDLCGHSVAVVQGSIPQQLADLAAKTCPSGKSMNVEVFPTQANADLAVRDGRADADLDTYGIGVYTFAHQPATGTKLEILSTNRYAVGYQAFVVAKDNSKLRDAMVAALTYLMKNGTYNKIFAKWGLTANEVPSITVNNAAKYKNYLSLNG